MSGWQRLATSIDGLNERIGRIVAWLTLLMIVVGGYNAIARYLGRFVGINLSSNVYLELQWYMFSLLFLLGGAYTLKHNAHVRVDVVYGRLSRRQRAWIDLAGTLLFLLPFCALAIVVSWPSVRNSWAVLEGSPDPGGLPRYPIKSFILVAFVLMIAQGIAQAIRAIGVLRSNDTPAEDA